MPHTIDTSSIIHFRHPQFASDSADWEKWRLTYEGGKHFLETYLIKFTAREGNEDFRERKKITPIPSFAKSAINDIRNGIFQRMTDIQRSDGSRAYQEAISGKHLGVDLDGSTMNFFMGSVVLTDLLIMGRVGIYVDMPVVNGPTIADVQNKRPYLYMYQVEDILSWSCTRPEEESEFKSVLLRDTCFDLDHQTQLPTGHVQRFRLLWINDITGKVNMQFFDADGQPVTRDGITTSADDITELDLTRIPFVMPTIGGSLLTDVCTHQIALLNLTSSDVSYALKANFPFYIEQGDTRAGASHLKPTANPDGTATAGGQQADSKEVKVGTTAGRFYDLKADAPRFIHPSSEPLKASIALQEKLEADVRKLVNLAVINIATQASAESKQMDNQGLEAGLSYIGLVLENAEKKIAEHWSAYENKNSRNRNVALVKYPERYNLKSTKDRIVEAKEFSQLMYSVPGHLVKKEIAKNIAVTLFNGKIEPAKLEAIKKEIDKSEYLTSDPDVIQMAKEQGFIPDRIGTIALGFNESLTKEAQEDHLKRIERVALAQGSTPIDNAAARGLPDADANPAQSGKEEKEEAGDITLNNTTQAPTRGKGKNNND